MPIYEYRCQSCGHELEKLQRMSDAALTDCPECGKNTLKRLISAAGFRLKGGGWYETDFKSSNQRNLVDSGKDSGKESGGDKASGADTAKPASAEGKSESKPAGKPEKAGSAASSSSPASS